MLIKIEIYMRTTHETIDFLSYEIIETEKLAFYANFNIFQCLSVLCRCSFDARLKGYVNSILHL